MRRFSDTDPTDSPCSMTGSCVIAGSIVLSAALFLPRETAAPEAASVSAPSARYQIVKADETRSWRLDTATGKLTLCRLAGDNLLCAESTEATRFPQKSPEQVLAERNDLAAAAEARRKERAAERTYIFDRFFALFERIIRLAEKHPDKVKPSAVPADET